MPGLFSALLKSRNPYEEAARNVYAAMLENTRQKVFYEEYGVPDNFDGRFDLLLLHAFVVMRVVLKKAPEQAEEFNQALFDATFADIDQTLREMGIGDMGVPKHMRKMMKAFNGRMHAYTEAFDSGAIGSALARNLFGSIEADSEILAKMEQKAQDMLAFVERQNVEDIFAGVLKFEEIG